MSPDGKTMLAVGDTNDVHLFETVGGGREFRKIGTYKGAKTSFGLRVAKKRVLKLLFRAQAPTMPDSPPRGAKTAANSLSQVKVR